MEKKKKVLVIGGTGYLGQHLLQGLSQIPSSPYNIAFTHHSFSPEALLHAFSHCLAFQADLRSGLGFQSILQAFGQPDVVVNCAALSVPRACEKDPDSAMVINVPSSLVNWLSSFGDASKTLLIHLSTDQVYEGVKSFYKEEDDTFPVNIYGKSKVAAEHFICEKWSNFAILRSSIIFGPQTISPVPKSLPIQLEVEYSIPILVLSKGDKVEYFHDEYRCPVYVKEVVNVILTLANRWLSDGKKMQHVLNVGGPDSVPHVQMVETVAQIRGYDTSLIKPVSVSSVDRSVKSPADISMDITKLVQTLHFSPTPFKNGVKLTLAVAEANS